MLKFTSQDKGEQPIAYIFILLADQDSTGLGILDGHYNIWQSCFSLGNGFQPAHLLQRCGINPILGHEQLRSVRGDQIRHYVASPFRGSICGVVAYRYSRTFFICSFSLSKGTQRSPSWWNQVLVEQLLVLIQPVFAGFVLYRRYQSTLAFLRHFAGFVLHHGYQPTFSHWYSLRPLYLSRGHKHKVGGRTPFREDLLISFTIVSFFMIFDAGDDKGRSAPKYQTR